MEENEQDTISRWRELVRHASSTVLPTHGGRLVKSLGDGMLIEFSTVPCAVRAAFEIQAACHRNNAGIPADKQMLLRMGVQVGELVADGLDVYGRDVNLAARLTTLAGPGEIVVSETVRDQLVPELDADIEDLGECYLKHVSQPIRAYRIGPPGPRPVIAPGQRILAEMRPTIAVIPFSARSAEPEHFVLGEVLADEIIAALSQTAELYVISRLSTTAFRDRDATLSEMNSHLKATYVLSGTYRVSAARLMVMAELADTRSGRIVWNRSLKDQVKGILNGKDELVSRIVAEVSSAVMTHELNRSQTQALPTLENYALLMGAIALMHHGSSHQFEHAQKLLETLIDRAPRQATPHAWLAKWHVLRVQKGWSDDLRRESKLALDCAKRALDTDPYSSLALTIDGFVHTNLLKQLDVAKERYDLALRVNPNDSLAWLLTGTRHAFKGEGGLAVKATERARKLSPLDPLRDWYDSLSATAALSAGLYERSIELAQSSLRLNRMNASTLRALAISQWLDGRREEARKTIGEVLSLEPGLTVNKFLERSPSSDFETGKLWSEALRQAGIPEGVH
jgi:adenylate cyclase